MGLFGVLQKVVDLRKYIWQADTFLKRVCSRRKIIELENDERNLRFKALRKSGTGIAQSLQRVGYRLGAPTYEFRKGAKNFSVLQNLQVCSVAYPASYRVSFLAVKSHRVFKSCCGEGKILRTHPGSAPRPTQPQYSEYRIFFPEVEQRERGAGRSEVGVDNG